MFDEDFLKILAGFALGLIVMAAVASSSNGGALDKMAFIEHCRSDNGEVIFADKKYCIKRSAFVETVR